MDQHKQLRYIDLMQIIEAMLVYYAPEVLQNNETYCLMEAEFDRLAGKLGFENSAAILEQLKRDEEPEETTDEDKTLSLSPGERTHFKDMAKRNGSA